MGKGKILQKLVEYKIWTDGGYSMKKGIGAFAHIILNSDDIEIDKYAEKVENSTNNRCELNAILSAVKKIPDGSSVRIYTDSQYCIGVMNGEYCRNKNLDILEEWDKVIKEKNLKVKFTWVKGHSGLKYNEMCDAMCNEVAGCDLNDFKLQFKKK